MFLHHILKSDENRLISKVFWAQEGKPIKNDWVTTVKENLKELGLDYLSLKQIKSMKKSTFRALVKKKCRKMALEYLLKEKESRAKSKLKNLQYQSLNLQI